MRWTILTSLAVTGMAVGLAACGGSSGSGSTSSQAASSTASGTKAAGPASGSLTVWVDSVRLPAAKAYQKAHPNVHVKIVTFDGDGNGATTLQTKIQLWNRAGNGWPDVIFSEQVNDPVWMAKKPFEFAAPVKGLVPDSVLRQWPAPSTAQCTIDGTQYCVQDNLAQVVLWVNKKLMDRFGYTVPTTWQEWAALGQKVATEHPGYIVGNSGDSFSHWIYLWGDQCPLEQLKGDKVLINSKDSHCTRMASLMDPLIKNGTVPPLSVFTPDFAKKYGGAKDKVLLMPGPAWYATALFHDTLHIPAGQITAAPPLKWENETPVMTGQVGGGPWIISKHSKNLKLRLTSSRGRRPSSTRQGRRPATRLTRPWPTRWLATLAKNPYFASDPTAALKGAAPLIWQGWNLVTYPDQPVWSNTVVTKLVAGKSLSSLMQPLGEGLAHAAQAAGYQVASSDEVSSPRRPLRTRRPREGGARAVAKRTRGLRSARGLPFVLPYLPFLILFGIAPMIYALKLAFTNDSGGWAGFHNFTRTFDDYRFGPAFKHILALHRRLARGARHLRRHAGAAPAWAGQPGLVDLPLPVLHPGRAGGGGIRPGLALHARPVGQPGLVPGAPRARGAALRRVDRARAPAVHLRDDRVLDRRRRVDRRHVRRAEHDPAGSRGGRADRWRRPDRASRCA